MDIIAGGPEVLGVQIRGFDVRTASDAVAHEVLAAVHQHALVRLKDQSPTAREYLEFGLKLGTMMRYPDPRYHHADHPDVFVSSNVKGRAMGMARSGYFWHTDLQFKPKPQALTVLYPQLLPQAKRETLFINMADVYDTLPSELRKLVDGRTAKHDPVLRYKVGQADVDANLDLRARYRLTRRSAGAPPGSRGEG